MADNLLDIDRQLAADVVFTMGTESGKKIDIKFQFPPKILNDSRTGSWFETEVPGNQPIATWKTSGARKWTLEWSYVIGADGWSVTKVRDQIIHMRSYWSTREDLATNFIVTFWIWKLGGKEKMTCRLTNIDITHGKALYIPPGDTSNAHPVITNIKAAMQLWTQGGDDFGAAKTALSNRQTEFTKKLGNEVKMDLVGLAEKVNPDWQ